MSKGMENPEINTYFVDYVPQVRYGVKISGGALAQDNLYLDGEPIDHQIKGIVTSMTLFYPLPDISVLLWLTGFSHIKYFIISP